MSFVFRGVSLAEYAKDAIVSGPPCNPMVSERGIELALALHYVKVVGLDILEIGAVTPYYWKSTHPVIDISDPIARAIHIDVMSVRDFSGKHVLSISTLEHVEHGGIVLQKILNECLTCMITVPLGWNPAFDAELIALGMMPEVYWRRNDGWKLERKSRISGAYGTPFPYANTVAVFAKLN